VFAFALSGCSESTTSDPGTQFQSIYGDYVHGNLNVAQTRAEEALRQARLEGSGKDTAWEMKFRLLDAEIVLRQGHTKEALALLTTDGEPFPTEGDLAIKRNVLCGLAHSRLGQQQESDQELREARRLAESTRSTLIGDVLRAEALVQRDSGHWDEAIEKFRRSLAVARQSGDPL